MGVEVSQKVVNLGVIRVQPNEQDHQRVVFKLLDSSAAAQEAQGPTLKWFMSLMGETRPSVSPLSIGAYVPGETSLYRYDWVFGIGCMGAPKECWWDWQAELRSQDSALTVQMLLSSEAGIGVTDISASLLALKPSRKNPSFFEKKGVKIARQLAQAGGDLLKQVNPLFGIGLNAFSTIPEAVASHEAEQVNWFMYRFLDHFTDGYGIEWRISKDVLKEYGPLLRGSALLTFHGEQKAGTLRMQLRPQMNFEEHFELGFSGIGDEHCPALSIVLQSPVS